VGKKPYLVSLGAQKNFERFMAEISENNPPLPDVPWYKQMIAKAILFKKATSIIRQRFQSSFPDTLIPWTYLRPVCFVGWKAGHPTFRSSKSFFVMVYGRLWRPQRDSNPCCRIESAVS
jgi:hypothetical protein